MAIWGGLALCAGVLLPGWLLARRLLPGVGPLESSVFAVLFGLSVVPTLAFCALWAFGVPLTTALIVGLGLGLGLLTQPWRLQREIAKSTDRTELALTVALALCAGLLVTATESRATYGLELFEPCLHQTALYLHESASAGWTLFDPVSGEHLTHVFAHGTDRGFGLRDMLDDQRPANGAVMGVAMTLVGSVAPELLAWLVFFAIAGAATLVAREVMTDPVDPTLSALCGVATLLGLHGLIAYMVNETTFAFAAGLGALALALRSRADARAPLTWLGCGVLLGFAIGSRLTAALWLLPIALLRPRPLALALGLSAGVPWLAISAVLTGDPFYYPSPEGTLVPHDLLGFTLDARPLNWPVHDQLLRHADALLPPLVQVPLAWLRSLGGLLAVAAAAGVWHLRASPRLVGSLLLWVLPAAIPLTLLAYLDYEKTSWLLLAAPPLPMALAAFAERVANSPVRHGLAWILAGALAGLLPAALATLDVPEDDRGYAVVSPDIEATPRSEADLRERLAAWAPLPDLHDVTHPSHFWRGLFARPGAPFRSGAIVLWQAHEDPLVLSFPVEAPTTPPPPAPNLQIEPFDRAEVHEGTLAVALALDTSPRPHLTVTEREHRFQVWVDPGPEPHTRRHIHFMIKDFQSDRFAGASVSLRGTGRQAETPVPIRMAGYLMDGDLDVKLITNGPLPPAPFARRIVSFGPEERTWIWWSVEGGTPPPVER